MLQTFTFDGGGRLVNMQADYFRYESGGAAGADESIRMRMDGQDLGTYLPGDAITLPRRGVLFEITPVNPACSGVIRLGLGRLDSARLVGTVRVVDEGQAKTLAGGQFAGAAASGASAGAVRARALRASTRAFAIKRLAVGSDVAGDMSFFFAQGAPLVTFTSGAGYPNKIPTMPAVALQSDQFSVVSAGGFITTTEYVTPLPFATLYVPANGQVELPLTTPLIVPIGWSCGVSALVVSRSLKFWVDGEML